MRSELILPMILVFSILIVNVSAYEITYRANSISENPDIAFIPSVYWSEDCEQSITLYATAGSSGAYSLTNYWYAPNSTQVGFGTSSHSSNITCRNMGTVEGQFTSMNDYWESSIETSYSADQFENWIHTTYDCDFDANQYFTYANTKYVDSSGFHPFGYGHVFSVCYALNPTQCTNTLTSDLNGIIDYLANNYYNTSNCATNSSSWYGLEMDEPNKGYTKTGVGGASDLQINYWVMIPFNSMYSGQVIINVTDRDGNFLPAGASGSFNMNMQYYLWDTYTNSTIDLGNAWPLNTIQNLETERDYWLFIGTRYYIDDYNPGGGDMRVEHNYTDYQIRIWAYEPDWSCGAWSDCEDSVRQRYCTDLNGVVGNKVEYETCDVGILENATLGFEDSTETTATICYPEYNIGTIVYGIFSGESCVYLPHNITVDRPLNWTVYGDGTTFNRYFLDFTSEWATEGSRSLKLWSIPPKINEWDGSLCSNKTTGNFPVVANFFDNTSMSVGFNVTFPATNMRLTFDVKRCDDQVRQNYELTMFNNSWIEYTACPEYCYASSCITEPTGQFYWNLVENATQVSILGNAQYVNLEGGRKKTYQYDLSTAGLTVGTVYELYYSIVTENPQDTRGNCVMIDNVRYDVLEEPFSTVVGDECISQCVGLDYYRAIALNNGVCIWSLEEYSESCLTSSIGDAIANLSDVCLSSDILLHYNPTLADYEEIDCDYGCDDGHCLTLDESTEITADLTLYDPPQIIADVLTEWGLTPANDLGMVWFFFSSFMIVNYVAVGFGIAVTRLFHDSANKENVHVDFKIFGSVTLIIIMSFFLAGYYPLEAGLTMIVILGLFLYYAFGDKLTGKGG